MPSLDLSGYNTGDEGRPLHAYVVLTIIYNAIFGGFLLLVRRRGKTRDLARQATPGNLPLFGIATYALSRLIAKDWVISPLRAPFTTYEGPASGSEVNERPRGHGMRLALGELIT